MSSKIVVLSRGDVYWMHVPWVRLQRTGVYSCVPGLGEALSWIGVGIKVSVVLGGVMVIGALL